MDVMDEWGVTRFERWFWGSVGWKNHPGSKIQGTNVGPTWGRQNLGGPHVGHPNRVIWAPKRHTSQFQDCGSDRKINYIKWKSNIFATCFFYYTQFFKLLNVCTRIVKNLQWTKRMANEMFFENNRNVFMRTNNYTKLKHNVAILRLWTQ